MINGSAHCAEIRCLIFFLFVIVTQGALGAITIEEDIDDYSLGPSLEFLEDPAAKLTIDEVDSSSSDFVFRPVQRNFPNMGFTESVYWFRAQLVNNTHRPQKLILEETSSWIDSIKVYTPDAESKMGWNLVHVGDKLPFKQREIIHQDFLIPIHLEAKESIPIYIRVESKSLLMMSLKLWKKPAYDTHSRTTILFFGFFFGILSITFIYNLFIYFSVRDPAYLYYILFIFSAALMAFTSNGFSYMYLWPESNWLYERMQIVSISMMQICGILFASRFLNTRKNLPKVNNIFRIFLVMHTVTIFMVPFTSELVHFAKLVVVAALVYSPLILLAGALAYKMGIRSAYYFLLAWSSSVIGVVVSVLTVHGLFEYTLFTYNATFVGVVIDIALLSIALADRINTMRRENSKSQKLVRDTLRRARDELEQKVEERTTEMALAREMADQANLAKSQFLSKVSHELRTPLNAILGFSRLLRTNRNNSLSSEQKNYVTHISTSGDHLLSLIDDVLDLSLVESGRLSLSIEAVSFHAVVVDALSIVGDAANHKQVTLIHQAQDIDRSLFVHADTIRLRQIVLNLLSNAIKYNRHGGEVRVSLEPCEGFVYLSISDTGKGISDRDLAGIFEPFNRLDEGGFGAEGAGIGLSIVKQLTEAMNGLIEVDSRVGVGTRFSIAFPVADPIITQSPACAESEILPLSPDQIGRCKILYIEDNPLNTILMRGILKEYSNIELLCAESGIEGVELAINERPDLIFTDINLPDLNGYEVLDRLGKIDDTASIPIIAITASAFKSEIERGIQSGFMDYLTKPVDVNTILNVIRNNTYN